MRNRLKINIIILTLFLFKLGTSQTRLDTLINILRLDSNYSAIRKAKYELQDNGKTSISYLIKLLKDTSSIQVVNTADLIYPGAKKFYGHGGILNYAINSVAVRAGWIIEEITFRDFGYKQQSINDQELIEFHKNNYKKYQEKGYHDIDFEPSSSRGQLKIYRLMLADSVSRWWENNKTNWTLFSTLKDALNNSDEHVRDRAVEYLLNCHAKNFQPSEKEELINLVKKHEIPGTSFHYSKEIFSDGNLVVVGSVYHAVNRAPIKDAKVDLYNQDSVLVKSIKTDKDGKYDFTISLSKPNKYILQFSYPSYYSKKCVISTEGVPENRKQSRFSALEIFLYLSEKVIDVDYSILNKPANIYYYNARRNDFTYDKKYLESVLPAFTELKKAEDAAKGK